MLIKAFFDDNTSTLTYVVHDPDTKDAVVIDPVLDFEPLDWRVYHDSVDKVAAYVIENNLNVHYIIDTHVHADHLSGMDSLKQKIEAKTAIGEKIRSSGRFISTRIFRSGMPLPASIDFRRSSTVSTALAMRPAHFSCIRNKRTSQ